MTQIFKTASRKKLRFVSPQGLLNVEDLWDLPLTGTRGRSINELYIALNATIEAESTNGLVSVVSQGHQMPK